MTTGTPPPNTAPVKTVTWWHYHRRMYDWMLSFAHSRYSTAALGAFSFCEAIFFPVPPFVLQIPLTLERRSRAWYYAAVTSATSVLGGLVGYAIGALFQDFAKRLFSETALHKLDNYTANVVLLTAAVVAVHPFKLFAIAAGFLSVHMGSFVIASAIGRSVLFFAIAAMLWFFGAPVRTFIDKYFNLLTIVFGAAIIALVVVAKML